MRRRGVLLAGLVMIMGWAVGWAAPESSGAAGGEKGIDPWRAYVLQGKWVEGAAWYRKAIVEACTGGGALSAKDVGPLYYGYRICTVFPSIKRIPIPDSEKLRFMRWLLQERGFTTELLTTLVSEDELSRAMEIVYVIWKRSGSGMRRNRNVAIAFAVVWDTYAPDNEAVRDAFSYYDRSASRMRSDIRGFPPVILKYVVDSQRPVPERKWALKRYRGYSNIGRLYEKPEYDDEAFFDGKPKKLSEHEYTLANILRYGGVCHDRAVFASEVGKAVGVPSVYIRGMSSAGMGHAWVGYLKRRGKRGYEWDLDSGRIGSEEVTAGEVLEPQSCIWVSEHELNLALRAMALSESARVAARMWLDTARLLAQARVGEEKRKRAAAAAIRRSLSAGVFDKSQWLTYAQLGAAGVFSAQEIEGAIAKFSADLKDDPPLAVDAFAALLGALGKADSDR